jgi:hypothetical protein
MQSFDRDLRPPTGGSPQIDNFDPGTQKMETIIKLFQLKCRPGPIALAFGLSDIRVVQLALQPSG